jgi:hypothetical protein
MAANRFVGPALAAVLLLGVGYGVYRSATEAKAKRDGSGGSGPVTLRGLVGSEKIDYLTDPRVVAALGKHGITLQIDKSGSREMASRTDLKDYDFAFPAGSPAAVKLQQATGAKHAYTPFFSPMAIASWTPIAGVLEANGIVKRTGDTYYIVDLHKLFSLITKGTRWRDLPQSDPYPIGKGVLVSTTDVRKSNSGAMYLALASYVMNGDNVVVSEADAQKVIPLVTPLFLRQGFQESSSAGPFEDYTTMGMGKAPLVLVYEAQFIQKQLQSGGLRKDMVLLYPQPTTFTKHTLIALKPAADRLGDVLQSDTTLVRLAAEFGLRSSAGDPTAGWATKGVKAPAQILDVIDPPTFEILERMILAIDSTARGTTPTTRGDSP